MDPRRLLTFRAVARAGSFSRAARELQISQPSVSQQVALLETEVGVRLFDRGRDGATATAAGRLLLEHADHLAWRLQLAQHQLGELANTRRDVLRIGAFPTALAGIVPKAIGHLHRRSPDAKIQIREITSDTEHPLLDGELDLALSYQDAANPRREPLDTRRTDLLQETFLIAMPLEHRLARSSRPIPLDAFADDDWIVPSTSGFLIDACRKAGFEPRVVSVSADPLATRSLIEQGIAVGLVPSLLAHAYTGIRLREISGPMPRRDIFALLPPGRSHPLAPAAIDALRAAAHDFTS